MLPLGLLFTGDRGDPTIGAGAIVTMFMIIAFFPVYYLALCALAVPITAAVGFSLPVDPAPCVVLAVLAVVMFTAFAYWTAAWTKNAGAAQLTSMPVAARTGLAVVLAHRSMR